MSVLKRHVANGHRDRHLHQAAAVWIRLAKHAEGVVKHKHRVYKVSSWTDVFVCCENIMTK